MAVTAPKPGKVAVVDGTSTDSTLRNYQPGLRKAVTFWLHPGLIDVANPERIPIDPGAAKCA
jgi:hypothetical protein